MAQETNYGLLIAALVAVVAIVGLVIFSTGGSSAVVFRSSMETPIVLGPQGSFESGRTAWYEMGRDLGLSCAQQDVVGVPQATASRCCNDMCTNACEGKGEYQISGRTVDDCFRNCYSGCEQAVRDAISIG